MTENNFGFKYIKLTDKLKKYFKDEALSLSDLADYYLNFSITTFDVLADYNNKYRKLKKAYKELLKLMQNIHHKKTARNFHTFEHDNNAIKNNKDHALKSLELYTTIVLKLKESKINFWITFTISIAVLIISISSVINQFIKPN